MARGGGVALSGGGVDVGRWREVELEQWRVVVGVVAVGRWGLVVRALGLVLW